jgi:tRNA pseudouridine38-40 synthase
MVKGLVSTMLRVGRNKISLQQFEEIIQEQNSLNADFSAPSKGLFLCNVEMNNKVYQN